MRKPQTEANKQLRALLKTGKRNKYGVAAKADRTWKGVVYHSKREMVEAQSLAKRLERGEIKTLSIQHRFSLYAFNFPATYLRVHVCDHLVDFLVCHNDGSFEVIEVKGMKTEVWKLKRKWFEACYPHIKYTVVK